MSKTKQNTSSSKIGYPIESRIKKTFLFSLILTVVFVIIIILAILFKQIFWPIKTILEIVDSLVNASSVILSLILTIVGAFSFFNGKKEKERVFISLFLVVIFLLIPYSVCAAGNKLLVLYEEKYLVSNVEQHELQDDVRDEKEDFTKSSNEKLDFEINFEDPYFLRYSVEQMENNKTAWVKFIIFEFSNHTISSSYPIHTEYEKTLKPITEYELTYIWMHENHVFESDRQMRISFLEKCIEIRENADYYYNTHENQNQIALRYADRAYEQFMNGNIEDAISSYENAIKWQLISICTLYRGSSEQGDIAADYVGQVVFYYENIKDIIPSTDNRHKKTVVLIEIYQSIEYQLR